MIRILLGLIFVFAAGAALADRAATPRERAAIEKALAAEGCTAGEDIEFIEDENIFELDNVSCSDGKLWEYDLDASYNVIDKQPQGDGDDDDDDDEGPQNDDDDDDDEGPQDDNDDGDDD